MIHGKLGTLAGIPDCIYFCLGKLSEKDPIPGTIANGAIRGMRAFVLEAVQTN